MEHLDYLESESIHILREAVAEARNPVMLYSLGKDSSVMLHLAKKAFFPDDPPFPLMHIDTLWKFQEMYEFRDRIQQTLNLEFIVYTNPDGVEQKINPFAEGAKHTHVMKTEALKQALDKFGFDVAFGGARREEEKSRAKERVFSFRNSFHRWDPRNQRPELWSIYNTFTKAGESIRVFPLSNWTELDVWHYIYRENIDVVPLYFSAERPVIRRNNMLLMLNDDRYIPGDDETIEYKEVRFRTLGCYPLTGAIESSAVDVGAIILELMTSRSSERFGRSVDKDSGSSLESKKQEGYF